MSKKILLIALGALALAGCSSQESNTADEKNIEPSCDYSMGVVGGWNPADITPEVEQAAAVAVKSMAGEHKLDKIYHARRQVVAGMNYFVTFSLDNGEYYSAIVFHSLKNTYQLREIKQVESANAHCNQAD